MDQASFEELEHTADWALRARGANLAALMLSAAQGMLSLMQATPAPGARRRSEVTVQASDPAALLVRWLEELLFRVETRNVTFTDLRIALPNESTLHADVEEAPLASLGRAIKAVTYHGLQVERIPSGYQATVVFDV